MAAEAAGYAALNRHTRVIVDEARARGVAVEVVDPKLGELCLRFGGRTVTTLESLSELTTAVAFRRCDDKLLTRRVLHDAGLPIAPGKAATFDNADLDFLAVHRDLVVKPARGEQGRGITVGVTTPEDLRRAGDQAQRHWPEVLLEKRCEGDDLRVVVIDGQVVAAAVRRPPSVTGTGTQPLGELIAELNRVRTATTGANTVVPLDEITRATVGVAGFASLDQVVPAGLVLVVRGTANVHTGGTIVDVTDLLHDDLGEMAVAAARAVDLPVAGVDLLITAVDAPDAVVIEVNEQPGLANHEPRPTAQRFVDLLFPETVRAAAPRGS